MTEKFTMFVQSAKALGRFWLLSLPKNVHFVPAAGVVYVRTVMCTIAARFAMAAGGLTPSTKTKRKKPAIYQQERSLLSCRASGKPLEF